MNPSDIPDSATVYVPGYGETTVGELRASQAEPADDNEATVRMWCWIVTHPHEVPREWRALGRAR